MVISLIYQGFVYWGQSKHGLQFQKRSWFFTLLRSEIIDHQNMKGLSPSAIQYLQKLLVIHNILFFIGRILLIIIIAFVAIMLVTKL